jgi:hypothetical protein
MRKPLPIGIQTFRHIVEGGFLYVDKTRWIYELIRYPKGVYFLSRPRRFGKSLLISILAEIFQGQRELFRGLWLYDQPYDWAVHPVIRVDFSLLPIKSAAALEQAIQRMTGEIARRHEIALSPGAYYEQFGELIQTLAARNQVVILIDEYDKPLLDNIDDLEEAYRIRETLKGFYTIIKGMDAYIRFVLLTGVSKFSRVGVFSGLNNLKDISLDDRFATMLGITQAELEADFQDYLSAFAEKEGLVEADLLAEIRRWYNGFCFSKQCEPVYNPFSTLLLFDMQDFRNYWFESGTPTFLIKLIRSRNYAIEQLDHLELDELAFSSYELDDLKIVPLLYQAGYLTIKDYDRRTRLYRLDYSNYEVENAFLLYLLDEFSHVGGGMAGGPLWRLTEALRAHDFARFFDVLGVFFADIPYDIQLPQERYYQTIFYLVFKLLGLRVGAEVRSSRGRTDLVLELADAVFVFELKLDASPADALAQIVQRGYAEPYRLAGRPVYLVGVAFDRDRRAIAGWQVEALAE